MAVRIQICCVINKPINVKLGYANCYSDAIGNFVSEYSTIFWTAGAR